jgi:concanavalin A-like lectin/glucanase superfamily protein
MAATTVTMERRWKRRRMQVMTRRSIGSAMLACGAVVVLLSVAGKVTAQDAPYVNGAIADAEFKKITAADMDRLRQLKILFGSRSFGQNMGNGIRSLAAKNPIYKFPASRFEASTFKTNGDNSVFPPDAFDKVNWVHDWVIASPWSKRIFTMKSLLEEAPHFYQDDIDVFMIYYHGGDAKTYPVYAKEMDGMRQRNPHIKFIYVTAGFEGPKQARFNASAAAFSDLVRKNYKGKVPLYDLSHILNDDGRCGNQYCPEYSSDPAQVHPNNTVAEERMAKGLLVILHKLFIENQPAGSTEAPTTPENPAGRSLDRYSIRLTWDFSKLPDCGVKHYLVQRDGKQVGVSKGFGFADRGLKENTEYTYTVAAVGNNGKVSSWSQPCKVRTFNDTERPALKMVRDIIRNDTIILEFSEPLDTASATNVANYTLAGGIEVQKAALAEHLVTLTTAPMPDNTTTTLTIGDVTDTSVNKNVVAPGTVVAIRYVNRTIDDVLAYWPLDGDAKDASGNGNDGKLMKSPAFVPGIRGKAMKLSVDGPSCADVRLPGSKKVNLDGTENFTMAVWAKKDDAAKGGTLLNRHVVYNMSVGADTVSVTLYNRDGRDRAMVKAKAPEIRDTEWHHYCAVYDGKAVVLYIDGTAKGQAPLTGNVRHDRTRNLTIGQGLFKKWFGGAIDEVRMYGWPLAEAKVRQLHAMGSAGLSPDLQAVQAILKANGDGRSLKGAAVVDADGRVTKLYLQNDLGGQVFRITADVGQLTELQLLHVYGPEDHDHAAPKLTYMDPAIAKCTKLTELLLNDNDLASLPEQITALKALKVFSVGNNRLSKVSDKLRKWLDMADPDWQGSQK